MKVNFLSSIGLIIHFVACGLIGLLDFMLLPRGGGGDVSAYEYYCFFQHFSIQTVEIRPEHRDIYY